MPDNLPSKTRRKSNRPEPSYRFFINSLILFVSCGSRAVVLINEPLENVRVILRKVVTAFAEYGVHHASGTSATRFV